MHLISERQCLSILFFVKSEPAQHHRFNPKLFIRPIVSFHDSLTSANGILARTDRIMLNRLFFYTSSIMSNGVWFTCSTSEALCYLKQSSWFLYVGDCWFINYNIICCSCINWSFLIPWRQFSWRTNFLWYLGEVAVSDNDISTTYAMVK